MSRPPHVLLVDAYPHLMGGAQRTLLALGAELRRRHGDVTVLVPGEGPLAEAARRSGLEVRAPEVPAALSRYGRQTRGASAASAAASLPPVWARLARVIASSGAEVVHVNDHRALLLAGPASRLARRPVVWHVHSVDVGGAWLERTFGRLASAVVAPSRASLARLGPTGKARQVVVRPPLNVPVNHRGASRRPGTGSLVTAGRLHPDKGIDLAITAVALLRGEGVDAHLRVYGTEQPGHEEHAAFLHRLPAELGIAESVTFRGHLEDPHAEWGDCDVYVQASRAETFGMAAAEAMALGVPVVAAAVGGLPELIDDGRSGILVPAEDPRALADAVASLIGDPVAADRLAAAGRAATDALTPERAVDLLLPLWRSLA